MVRIISLYGVYSKDMDSSFVCGYPVFQDYYFLIYLP